MAVQMPVQMSDTMLVQWRCMMIYFLLYYRDDKDSEIFMYGQVEMEAKTMIVTVTGKILGTRYFAF